MDMHFIRMVAAAFGQYSAGNSSDLEQATRLVTRYVAIYGMSECGMVQFLAPAARLGGSGSRLEDLPQPVIDEMNRLLNDAFERAKQGISSNQARCDNVVDMLVRKRKMMGDRLMQGWGAPDVPNDAEGG